MAFLFILGQALPAHLVGGCGARAVSRKTPIYFINTLSSHKKRRTKGHIAESDIVCDVGEVLWCHQAHFSDAAGHIHYTFKYNLVTHDLG